MSTLRPRLKATPPRRHLTSPPSDRPRKPPTRIWNRAAVEAAAAAKRRHEQAVDSARWATSWMMPWERAQMDFPNRPLKLWERVYWRLFVVLGGVGFAYETWVLGNRRILLPANSGRDVGLKDLDREVADSAKGLYHGNHAFRSDRFFTDDEIETVANK